MAVDIWSEPVAFPMVTAGRRRTLGRCVAGVSVLCGGLAVLGSCLPWTYIDGGDGPSLAVGGLSRLPWGLGTLLAGVALILTGTFASLYISRIRFLVPAAVAAGGLALAAEASVRSFQLDTGEVVPADPRFGLVYVLVAYSVAVASILLLFTLDLRWFGPETMSAQVRRRTTPAGTTKHVAP
jgi:hypothetical protein